MQKLAHKDLDSLIEGFMNRKAAEFPELRLREPRSGARIAATEHEGSARHTPSAWRLLHAAR